MARIRPMAAKIGVSKGTTLQTGCGKETSYSVDQLQPLRHQMQHVPIVLSGRQVKRPPKGQQSDDVEDQIVCPGCHVDRFAPSTSVSVLLRARDQRAPSLDVGKDRFLHGS